MLTRRELFQQLAGCVIGVSVAPALAAETSPTLRLAIRDDCRKRVYYDGVCVYDSFTSNADALNANVGDVGAKWDVSSWPQFSLL